MPSRSLRRLAALALLALTFPALGDLTEDTYGSWTVRCESVAGGRRECIMLQSAVLRTSGQPVLVFTLSLGPTDGIPTVFLSLPLGITLPPGIAIQIDDGKPAGFPVDRCEPDGCRAVMRLREATLTQLAAGERLIITFYDGERHPIEVPLSLDGFSESYAALRAAES